MDGPVKAWIEPDSWAHARAYPAHAVALFIVSVGACVLALILHPLFWPVALVAMLRQATAEAALRDLWREGMLHPAMAGGVVDGTPSRIAALVRLESRQGVQDAVVVRRAPRRWRGMGPPWGGQRCAVVMAGDAPRLRPLSVDLATGDDLRAKRTTERIPETQWAALDRALAQVAQPWSEGVHPVQLDEQPWYGVLSSLETEGSLPAYLSERTPTAFCASLPCVEEVALVPRERERIRGLRAAAMRRAGLLFGVAVAAPLGLTVLSRWEAIRANAQATSTVALLGGLSLLMAPLVGVLSLSALRKVRAYSRDLAEGRVLRFLGQVSSFDSLSLDPDLALLARRGVIIPEPGTEQDLVVLPHVSEVLYANGAWAPPGLRVRVERVAVPPSEPFKMPLPPDVQTEPNDAVSLGRRRLTELETAELRRHALSLRRPGPVFWMLTAIAAAVLSAWHGQAWAMPPKPLSILLALVVWLFSLTATLKRFRLAGLLAEDATLGWVVTIDSAQAGCGKDAGELPARGVETLLHARLDWTVNRRPATWRRFASRSGSLKGGRSRS